VFATPIEWSLHSHPDLLISASAILSPSFFLWNAYLFDLMISLFTNIKYCMKSSVTTASFSDFSFWILKFRTYRQLSISFMKYSACWKCARPWVLFPALQNSQTNKQIYFIGPKAMVFLIRPWLFLLNKNVLLCREVLPSTWVTHRIFVLISCCCHNKLHSFGNWSNTCICHSSIEQKFGLAQCVSLLLVRTLDSSCLRSVSSPCIWGLYLNTSNGTYSESCSAVESLLLLQAILPASAKEILGF
jgi:hypothetical protein